MAQLAMESGKPLIVAVNKWDLVRDEMMKEGELEKLVFARLEFIRYAPVLTVSALTGKRVVRILDLAETVWKAGPETVGTADLNQFLDEIHRNNSPMTPSGRRFRIKYMTQAGVLPPSFRLFAGRNGDLRPGLGQALRNPAARSLRVRGQPDPDLLPGSLSRPARPIQLTFSRGFVYK